MRASLRRHAGGPLAVTGILVLAGPAPFAQDPRDVPAELAQRIDVAIDAGVRALLAQQELDGSWRAHLDGYGAGMTALSLYTLLKSGVPRTHPAVERAAVFLRANPPDRTYTAAVELLALTTLGDPTDRSRIRRTTERLVSWQRGGGFAYPDGEVDLSNAQYAALGLRAAARSGCDVPRRTWDRLVDEVIACQEDEPDGAPAGFLYRRNSSATGSMTTAGLTTLAICREMGATSRELEGSLERGLAWLGREFSVRENPKGEPVYQYLYYYIYGLERVASLLDLATIAGEPWYRSGAEFLLGAQADNGRFGIWGNQDETCFALLFLSRATAPVSGQRRRAAGTYVTDQPAADLVLRASGDAPFTFWIESVAEARVAELSWVDEAGAGLHVGRIEYLLQPSPTEPVERLLASLDLDDSRPVSDGRFAVQHVFERPGSYAVVAALHVLLRIGDEVVLRSPPLTVVASQAANPDLGRYAHDPAADLLLSGRVKATASSHAEHLPPHRAVDGRTASGWRSDDADHMPAIRLELSKPVKCDTLLLTHLADLAATVPSHAGRPLEVEVAINGSKRPLRVELRPSDWEKTLIDLGAGQRVKELEIRVLRSSPGVDGRDGVGFGEIELQRRD